MSQIYTLLSPFRLHLPAMTAFSCLSQIYTHSQFYTYGIPIRLKILSACVPFGTAIAGGTLIATLRVSFDALRLLFANLSIPQRLRGTDDEGRG